MNKNNKASVILVTVTAIVMMLLVVSVHITKKPKVPPAASPSEIAAATVSPMPVPEPTAVPLPAGFADVTEYVPDAVVDMRYFGNENFVGRPVTGYEANRAILTSEACEALKKAADLLRAQGYRIYIYDAYRPADAVRYFVTWGQDKTDTVKKADYYPDLEKEDLFKMYISSDSNHSRGSTVDLTIINADGSEVDTGGHFDFFGEISHTYSIQITDEQLANRKLLRKAMEEAGFIASNTEWWHFLLENQPYSEAFNFYVK